MARERRAVCRSASAAASSEAGLEGLDGAIAVRGDGLRGPPGTLQRRWPALGLGVPTIDGEAPERCGALHLTGVRSRLPVLEVRAEHLLRVFPELAHKGLLTGAHEPQHKGEGEDVDPVGVLLVAHNLRRHVAPRADAAGHPRLTSDLRVHQLAQAEIRHLQVLRLIEQQIQRLEVPVDDGPAALVQEGQRARHGARPLEHLALRRAEWCAVLRCTRPVVPF
mmetsp:Transcript_77446/g.224714  ORF Transcript_77446/g.224714 Transcript_77446/m.224714 type:complete len:222 (+) Transcript_77446:280-945(+)